MIIAKLTGGLGNQMFQYAAARRLAFVHKTDLKLDLSWFNSGAAVDTMRKYSLEIFAIQANCALSEEVGIIKNTDGGRFLGLIKRSVNRIAPLFKDSYVRERHFHFDPRVMNLPDNVYLEGYWQSEKYFSDVQDIIRREFVFKAELDLLDVRNKMTVEAIENAEAVSIHVRRGDYVSSPANSRFHGICSLDYYKKAIERIAIWVAQPVFFIFSDDPDWVKENLRPAFPAAYIDHNGQDNAYEDMRLISLCKHHIIANSSFSWWGAWLCNNPGKIVIAPREWFRNKKINTNDLIPERWIRM